jgi:hypothetical protein
VSNGVGKPSDRLECRCSASLRYRGIPSIALALCLVTASAHARGLLGLFAGEDDVPAPVPAAATPASIEPGRPVAWVSALRGVTDPAAQLYGYVPAGTMLDLGSHGEITLTWFTPCREESLTSGLVRVTAAGPQPSGGPPSQSRALSCQPIARLLPGDGPAPRMAAEGPFDPRAWYEVPVNSPEPILRWESAPGAQAQISVIDLDADEPHEIWSAKAYSGAASYPHEAAPIQPGRPYLVRATLDDGTGYGAVFSYDPDLSYSNAPINALVLLRAVSGGAP